MAEPEHSMRPEDAIALLNAGLERDKIALTNLDKLLSKLAKQFETHPSLLEIMALAVQVFESEETAYKWLVREHGLLKGKSPLQVMLAGDGVHVTQLLANIEYGMPP